MAKIESEKFASPGWPTIKIGSDQDIFVDPFSDLVLVFFSLQNSGKLLEWGSLMLFNYKLYKDLNM